MRKRNRLKELNELQLQHRGTGLVRRSAIYAPCNPTMSPSPSPVSMVYPNLPGRGEPGSFRIFQDEGRRVNIMMLGSSTYVVTGSSLNPLVPTRHGGHDPAARLPGYHNRDSPAGE